MELDFRLEINGKKLVIAIAQDYQTDDVLMVAFMNKEAVEQSLKTKKAHYYSTSRGKQWLKGESSGNVQTIKEIFRAACHEGYKSCFFRQLDINQEEIDIDNLTDNEVKTIAERLFDPKEMYR